MYWQLPRTLADVPLVQHGRPVSLVSRRYRFVECFGWVGQSVQGVEQVAVGYPRRPPRHCILVAGCMTDRRIDRTIGLVGDQMEVGMLDKKVDCPDSRLSYNSGIDLAEAGVEIAAHLCRGSVVGTLVRDLAAVAGMDCYSDCPSLYFSMVRRMPKGYGQPFCVSGSETFPALGWKRS